MAGIRTAVNNEIINIGTGEGRSIIEIIEVVSKIIGLEPKLSSSEKRLIDVKSNILDNSKAIRALDWRPKVGLEAGIRKTYEWQKKR